MTDISFYGLLHIDEAKRAAFDAEADADDPFMVYIRNAIVSGRSLMHFGYPYRLVTNAPIGVARRLALAGGDDIALLEHEFVWQVPRGVPFFSAHYKLELAELLASGALGERVALLDLDTAMIAPLALEDEALYVCDHTAREVTDAMRRDLALIAGQPLDDPSWIGGEFLLGRPAHFAPLIALIKRDWARYIEHIATYQIVSDETPLAAAIAQMKAAGDPIAPAEVAGGLARHWSIRTSRPMRPLRDALRASILHLPADKHFLAREAARPFDPAAFTRRYVAYARRRKLDAVAKWLAAPLFGAPRQHLPR